MAFGHSPSSPNNKGDGIKKDVSPSIDMPSNLYQEKQMLGIGANRNLEVSEIKEKI